MSGLLDFTPDLVPPRPFLVIKILLLIFSIFFFLNTAIEKR